LRLICFTCEDGLRCKQKLLPAKKLLLNNLAMLKPRKRKLYTPISPNSDEENNEVKETNQIEQVEKKVEDEVMGAPAAKSNFV
jgi:hypothetical protein